MKSIKKLKLARESIRLLSIDELQGTRIAGGNSGQESCGASCEPSGIVPCRPSLVREVCL